MSKYTLYSKRDLFLGDDIMYTATDIGDFQEDKTTDAYTELALAKLKLLKLDITAEAKYHGNKERTFGDHALNYQSAMSVIQTQATLQFWCDLADLDYDTVKNWLLKDLAC